ncbi:MAG: hypothetical protein LBH59_06250 [Planctomycetaceae bacterium]|nr:hypothetical protein [Planctomycetaceae bacterium]
MNTEYTENTDFFYLDAQPCVPTNYSEIPKPVWAVGFALEQTLHDTTLNVFSYVDFKVASAYSPNEFLQFI